MFITVEISRDFLFLFFPVQPLDEQERRRACASTITGYKAMTRARTALLYGKREERVLTVSRSAPAGQRHTYDESSAQSAPHPHDASTAPWWRGIQNKWHSVQFLLRP